MSEEDELLALLRQREPEVARPGAPYKVLGKPRDGLYGFQAAAEDLLQSDSRRVNLLVTARTGGGKTYVVEVAFRVARARGSVVLVGEPLVALALQVQERLGGARTGAALTTGPIKRRSAEGPAVAYVGTYEALAAMCASDHPALAGCSHVVLDEVHNIASEDRAQALQEIFDYCRRLCLPIIGLSGTLPNDWKVADYLSAINGLDTCIIGSDARPVPLEKYFYDRADGRFWPLRGEAEPGLETRALGGVEGRQDLLRLLRALQAGDWLPALVVNFSCRVLDEWAAVAADALCFLKRRERSRVAAAFDAAIASAAPQDRPLFERLRRFAARGVFLHHGHLPPRYSGLVVRLAGQSLAPLVLTTSTLAMGLNFPTRTVVLTAAQMPQRTPENTVALAPVEAKLVQQLFGRAGRKGYEPVGYAVVVGYGEAGFRQAVAFDARTLPPIIPSDRFSHGDVLRAAVQGRCVAMDREAFQDTGAAFALRVHVGHAEDAAARALAALPLERRAAVRAAAADAKALLHAEPALRDLVAVAGEPEAWLREGAHGELGVDAEGSVPLRTAAAKPLKRLPLQLAARALELREAAVRLLTAELSRAEWLACSVLVRSADRLAALRACSGFQLALEHKRDLCAAGLLSDCGAPTDLGVACARVRSCPNPAAVLPLVGEALPPEELARRASLLVGDGALLTEEASGPVDVPGVTPSAPRFVEAVRRWIRGGSLLAIHEELGVSCGEMCRHVVRAHGLLLETRAAAAAAGRADLSVFDEAERLLRVGGGPMPFEFEEDRGRRGGLG
jgi:hypothetical protein